MLNREIRAAFGGLKYRIQQFTYNHFGDFKSHSTLPCGFAEMTEENRKLFLEAVIADQLYKDLFEVKLFGLDKDMEASLGKVEHQLEDQRVPSAEISSWCANTLEVTKSLRSAEARLSNIRPLVDETYAVLNAYVEFDNRDAAVSDLITIYESAHSLALIFRESKTELKWGQKDDQAIAMDDFHVYGNFYQHNREGGYVPHRILFGPVYRFMAQETVLVDMGELMMPRDG